MDVTEVARAKRRFAYFLAFVVATAVVAFFRLRELPLTPELVRETVLGWGALAPIGFVLLFAARPVLFFPSTVLFITGGIAFGPVLGTLYAALGGTIAAVITFLVARFLGREFVQARLPARLQRFQATEWGPSLVFVLYLLPIVPLTAVNYGAGLSAMSLSHYTIAVVAGLMPRAFAYCFFGDSLLDLGSRQFILAVALLFALAGLSAWLRYRWAARSK